MKTFYEFFAPNLADRLQFDYPEYALKKLQSMGIDVKTASFNDLKDVLENVLGLKPTEANGDKLMFAKENPNDGWHVFITRIKSAAMKTTQPSDFEGEWVD